MQLVQSNNPQHTQATPVHTHLPNSNNNLQQQQANTSKNIQQVPTITNQFTHNSKIVQQQSDIKQNEKCQQIKKQVDEKQKNVQKKQVKVQQNSYNSNAKQNQENKQIQQQLTKDIAVVHNNQQSKAHPTNNLDAEQNQKVAKINGQQLKFQEQNKEEDSEYIRFQQQLQKKNTQNAAQPLKQQKTDQPINQQNNSVQPVITVTFIDWKQKQKKQHEQIFGKLQQSQLQDDEKIRRQKKEKQRIEKQKQEEQDKRVLAMLNSLDDNNKEIIENLVEQGNKQIEGKSQNKVQIKKQQDQDQQGQQEQQEQQKEIQKQQPQKSNKNNEQVVIQKTEQIKIQQKQESKYNNEQNNYPIQQIKQQQQSQNKAQVDNQKQQSISSNIKQQAKHIKDQNKKQQSSQQQQLQQQQQQQIQLINDNEKDATIQKQIINHPNRIALTQENQPFATLTHNNQHNLQQKQNKAKQTKIVQFVQYDPHIQNNTKQDIKASQNNKDGENKKNNYQGIQNQNLLKRIQQLQDTVKQLKTKKQANNTSIEHQISDENQVKTLGKNHEQKNNQIKKKYKQQIIIHDASVHGLVSELAKTQSQAGSAVKKPMLHQKRYKKRKVDLTSLMDKNIGLQSNIFNVTIGQIINPNAKDEQEKQTLRRQIRQLREKVLKLEEDKRASSIQKPTIQTRRQTASTGKKQMCGKLIKVSQLRASRVTGFDDNDSLLKTNPNQFGQTKSQRDSFFDGVGLKQKISNNSTTQREQVKQPKQKDDINNMSFRVRRPTAKSNNPISTNYPVDKTKNSSMSNNMQEKVDILPVSTLQIPKAKQQKNSKIDLKKQWWEQQFIKPIQMPELSSPPTPYDSQQDLYTLGKLTFIAFGVNFDSSKQMNVKKYKNCVYFNIGQKNNILWYFDGRFYFGEWQIHLTGEGQKSGYGFQYVSTKFIYQGQFKQGKRNGFGKMKVLNKQKQVMYEGNWVDGNKNGEGKQIDEYGIKYWGQWKQNKREGFGRLKLDDGDYYEGNFQKGIKTGLGFEHFKNGDRYQGNYLANKFHGKGKYMWVNGSVYEGQFNHGIRSGYGKWKSSETTEQIDEYQGQYENDKKNGFGKYRWADGSQYQGYFKDDLKQGEGTIRYKNGKVAKLLWKNGQPMKKLFSQQQKQYREGQKSKQKFRQSSKDNAINRNQTMSSRHFSLSKDD